MKRLDFFKILGLGAVGAYFGVASVKAGEEVLVIEENKALKDLPLKKCDITHHPYVKDDLVLYNNQTYVVMFVDGDDIYAEGINIIEGIKINVTKHKDKLRHITSAR